jgi:uncharacterized protein (TIGR03083 family)
MSHAAIEALTTESERALALFRTLTAEEWRADSGCTGWRVQDVACHMASVYHSIADPSTIEGGTSPDVEENAEVPVQARRDWTPEQVIAEYVEWSEKGIAAMTGMQEEPLASMVIPLANLGSHPMHILANAIVFDHYCHLRHDIGRAVARAAELPHDDAALRATLEWMLAGLPQMCATALAGCEQAVNLVFDGPGGGSYLLAPVPGGEGWAVTDGADPEAPSVFSSAHDFVSWGTKRRDWREVARLDADPGVADRAAATLDAINVI